MLFNGLSQPTGFVINRSTICKYVNSGSPYNPIGETHVFENGDCQVYSWIHLENIYKPLSANWKWYNPGNILAGEYSHTTGNPADYGYEYWDWYKCWSWLNISNNNNYGQWHVDIYINGQKVKTDYFTILAPLPPPQPKQPVPEHPDTDVRPKAPIIWLE